MRRTKAQRDYIEEFIRRNTTIKIDEVTRYIHLESMFKIDVGVLNSFLNMGWTLHINVTSLSYWTSDNPVVLKNSINFDPFTEKCHFKEGFKMYFPLTPKLCMVMYDPSVYKCPSKVLDTDIQSVIEKNKFQIENAALHILSRDDISGANKL